MWEGGRRKRGGKGRGLAKKYVLIQDPSIKGVPKPGLQCAACAASWTNAFSEDWTRTVKVLYCHETTRGGQGRNLTTALGCSRRPDIELVCILHHTGKLTRAILRNVGSAIFFW